MHKHSDQRWFVVLSLCLQVAYVRYDDDASPDHRGPKQLTCSATFRVRGPTLQAPVPQSVLHQAAAAAAGAGGGAGAGSGSGSGSGSDRQGSSASKSASSDRTLFWNEQVHVHCTTSPNRHDRDYLLLVEVAINRANERGTSRRVSSQLLDPAVAKSMNSTLDTWTVAPTGKIAKKWMWLPTDARGSNNTFSTVFEGRNRPRLPGVYMVLYVHGGGDRRILAHR